MHIDCQHFFLGVISMQKFMWKWQHCRGAQQLSCWGQSRLHMCSVAQNGGSWRKCSRVQTLICLNLPLQSTCRIVIRWSSRHLPHPPSSLCTKVPKLSIKLELSLATNTSYTVHCAGTASGSGYHCSFCISVRTCTDGRPSRCTPG